MKSVEEMRQRLAAATGQEVLGRRRQEDASKGKLKEARGIIRALERELETIELRQAFLDVLEEAPDPDPLMIRPGKRKKGSLPPATFFALASDWHVGERVRPENVQHRNEYSPEIAQERANQYFDSVLTMLNASRGAWTIDEMVFWLGGDLMTGYIHEEYLSENFLSPTEEALLAHEVLVSGIDRLLAESDCKRILIPTSNGNHGRTGKKINVAAYARNSYEWMLYQFLERHYHDEPRVQLQIANGYNNVLDVYGFRVNFHHGDAIGYGGGVGGLSIPALRRIGRQAQGIPPEWEGTDMGSPHLNVFGHFHQRLHVGPFIVNGSLIGWNDFAERIGCPFEVPAQTCFVIDERYRAVSHYSPLLVDKTRIHAKRARAR